MEQPLAGKLGGRTLGAAQAPKTLPWKPNPGGARSIGEALEIAKRHGVEIADDVAFFMDEFDYIEEQAEAQYFSRYSWQGSHVAWADFYAAGKIPVKVRASVFESDEAIVAVFAHEMHELNELRKLFAASGGAMSFDRLHELISPGIARNLHDEAWDVADALVQKIRGTP